MKNVHRKEVMKLSAQVFGPSSVKFINAQNAEKREEWMLQSRMKTSQTEMMTKDMMTTTTAEMIILMTETDAVTMKKGIKKERMTMTAEVSEEGQGSQI